MNIIMYDPKGILNIKTISEIPKSFLGNLEVFKGNLLLILL
jgi:hypothetical protein